MIQFITIDNKNIDYLNCMFNTFSQCHDTRVADECASTKMTILLNK